MGGVETVAAAVQADLAARLPSQNKKQREGLALLVATALDVRSVNLMELAAALPRAAERLDMRYQWISRLLGNARIEVEAVMAPYAREVLARACAGSRALVVIIDQSKVNDAHHMVMVSLRVGERALPLAWRVKKTQGAIGFREQRAALATVAARPCCTDRRAGALAPTLSGSGDADGPRASELRHAVEHVDGHVHLGRAAPVRARAQPVPDHALEPADGGLGPGPRVVARRLLPSHSALLGDELEVAVALRRRGLGRALGTAVERGGTTTSASGWRSATSA